MVEVFKQLTVSSDIRFPLSFGAIRDNATELVVEMRDLTGKSLLLRFEERQGYQVWDESDFIGRWNDSGSQLLSGIYEVENSRLKEWLSTQSIHDEVSDEIRFFLVVFEDDVLEVGASREPTISNVSA